MVRLEGAVGVLELPVRPVVADPASEQFVGPVADGSGVVLAPFGTAATGRVFDAEEALAIIRARRGTMYDPRVVDALLAQHQCGDAAAGSERVTYTAPDGSEVTLRPHTSLYALDAEAGTMRYRVEGEAFFAVVRDPSRTFVVEADGARVQVLGTRFDVSTWGERTSVYLEEGRVRFEHVPTGQAVMLAPGQRSVVTDVTVRQQLLERLRLDSAVITSTFVPRRGASFGVNSCPQPELNHRSVCSSAAPLWMYSHAAGLIVPRASRS